MRRWFSNAAAGAALVIGLTVSPWAEAGDDPANVIKYRIATMRSIGGHMGALAAIAKGEVSFTDQAAAHARGLAAVSTIVGALFVPGTDVGETRAKPEIWQQRDKFRTVVAAFQAAAAKMAEVAKSGDRGAIGAQLGALGKTCGGCHKPFRKEKK